MAATLPRRHVCRNAEAARQGLAWLDGSTARRWAIIALFIAVAVVKVGKHLGAWGTPPLTDKRTLAPLRLLHAGLTIMLLGSLIVMFSRYLDYLLVRLVALVGRQTRYGFAVSIPATYLAAAFWFANGRSYAAYLLACAFVLSVVIAAAWVMEARSRRARLAGMNFAN